MGTTNPIINPKPCNYGCNPKIYYLTLLKQLVLGGLGVIFDLNFVLSFIIESIVISRKLILQVREVMTIIYHNPM
jgi:hypothetical protein